MSQLKLLVRFSTIALLALCVSLGGKSQRRGTRSLNNRISTGSDSIITIDSDLSGYMVAVS